MENMVKGHCTKMGADKSDENAPKFISPNCLPASQKLWDFDEKRLHWASVVRCSATYLCFAAIRSQLTKRQISRPKNHAKIIYFFVNTKKLSAATASKN